jgi:pimeloyl-ACP methyl ester carboxylesterase
MKKLTSILLALALLLTTFAMQFGSRHTGIYAQSNLPPCNVKLTGINNDRILIFLPGINTNSNQYEKWTVYERLLDDIYDGFVYFSYFPFGTYFEEDTHKSILGHHVPALASLVESCMANGHTSIDLMGHSLGGVVALDYLKVHGVTGGQAGHIKYLITLDSPVNGSSRACVANFDPVVQCLPLGEQIFLDLVQPAADYIANRGNPGAVSEAGQELAMRYLNWKQERANNATFIKWLARQNGTEVWTFTNADDFVIPKEEATIPGVDGYNSEFIGFFSFAPHLGRWDAQLGHSRVFADEPLNINLSMMRIQIHTLLSSVSQPSELPSPQPAPPRVDDAANFLFDITLPDGTLVTPNQALQKVWRVKNTGTSSWDGFKLIFTEGDQMGGASSRDLLPLAPNGTYDISLSLRAPNNSGRGCWQIVNRSGVHVPGGKLCVSLTVVGSSNGGATTGHIAAFSASPGSPSNASTVVFAGRVNWWPGYRAMRVKVANEVIGETAATEGTFTWNAGNAARGDHAVLLEVASQTDTSWSNPERTTLIYTLNGTPTPANHAPNRPSPKSPYNWFVYYTGNTATLCGQPNGDPDGDTITAYQFDIFDSAELWNSGWVGGDCATTRAMGAFNYQWRVKVRDSRGAESDWSEPWHFSLVRQDINITQLYFEPQDPKSELVKIRACTEGQGGVGIAMRALVNDASDGSDRGQWHIIKELGVPCFNATDAPEWRTLTFDNGSHRVRIEAFGNTEATRGRLTVREEVYTLPERRPAEPILRAPIPPDGTNDVVYHNTRQLTFRWGATPRAQSYQLFVSTQPSPKDNPNLVNQTLASSATEHTVTFNQDYPQIYWQVRATNNIGSIESVIRRIGIDQQAPTCTVQPVASPVWESVFQVNWGGSDNLSGVHRYDIQVMDLAQGAWTDWLMAAAVGKTYELFTGQTGHRYAFRCRSTDVAGNLGSYPANANTTVFIDAAARPVTPWWNTAYAYKRSIILQNNQPNSTVPNFHPIHLRFDSTTTPTAAELYAASASNPKCADLRIVYHDTTELNRVVQTCSSSNIDIWFQTQDSFHSSAPNTTAHQLYYGNPNAGAPPAAVGNVLHPAADGNTRGLWYTNQATGSTLADVSGYNLNCSFGPLAQWVASGKFGNAVRIQGGTSGQAIHCGSSSQFDLSEFTFELFVRRTNFVDGRIAGNLNNGSPNRWLLSFADGGRVNVDIWEGGACGTSSCRTARKIEDMNWHHIAFTVKGAEVKIYIDGNLETLGTMFLGGIRSGTPPLTMGSAENINSLFGEVANIRFSNIARTSFPHGGLALITTEPSATVGDLVAPPVTGSADLAVLNLNTYPNPGGGILVETVVQNQGDLSTRNNFFTDLYVDHAPSAPGDFTGSVYRWIASPIEAGKTITLTTLLTDSTQLTSSQSGSAQTVVAAAANITEITKTLYIQTDSAGVVGESQESNNLALPVQVCFATADPFEDDNDSASATPLLLNTAQTHNLHLVEDQDWFYFDAQAGTSYRLETSNLGLSSDTYLYVYATDGTTVLASNDDYGDTLASQVEWTAPASGRYYAVVKHWNPNVSGCATSYDLRLSTATPAPQLTIKVKFQGRSGGSQPHNVPIKLRIKNASGDQVIYETGNWVAVAPDSSGGFGTATIDLTSAGLTEGQTYRFYVRGAMHLDKLVTVQYSEGMTLDLTNTAVNPDGVLWACDINQDNMVSTIDTDLLSSRFGQSHPGTPDPTSVVYRSDQNGDGVINILDYTICSNNFGKLGDDPASPVLLLSSSSGGTVQGVKFADEDILSYNPTTGAWALFFDGSDVGLRAYDIDAMHFQADGTLLLSVDKDGVLPGVGAVDDSDILSFVPTSLGTTTAGTFSIYFDGSDVGLEASGEDIDAFSFTRDGRLLISTLGSISVPGASGKDEDLFVFNASSLGTNTAGTWEFYFDGSDVGLVDSTEDIWGVDVGTNGELYLTTQGAFSVQGVKGDGADIFLCIPGSIGATTSCTFSMYWDGSTAGFGAEVVDAFDLVDATLIQAASMSTSDNSNDEQAETDDDPLNGDFEETDEEDGTPLFFPLIKN